MFVLLLNKTMITILLKCIPHEAIFCGDRNLPWMNKKIKKNTLPKNALKMQTTKKLKWFPVRDFA